MSKGGAAGCIVTGAICGVTGLGMYIGGNGIKKDYQRQIISIFSSGRSDSAGEVLTTLGIALAVIGVILILIGIVVYFSANKASSQLGLEGTYFGQYTNDKVTFYPSGKCTLTKSGVMVNGKFRRINYDYWVISIGSVSMDVRLRETNLEISSRNYKDTFTRI